MREFFHCGTVPRRPGVRAYSAATVFPGLTPLLKNDARARAYSAATVFPGLTPLLKNDARARAPIHPGKLKRLLQIPEN